MSDEGAAVVEPGVGAVVETVGSNAQPVIISSSETTATSAVVRRVVVAPLPRAMPRL
ncbi:hypothetical protein GCM10022204_45560 [Microlunatus aurantiacus]|uniref:Uncharacterized protein n=1 Tax=Microlunatus aurantiacus TaxID=446786 RepID=A0ABP7EKI5_9ACTN